MKAVTRDITTSTTEDSTDMGSGFYVLSLKNIDASIAITVSFESAISTATYKSILAAGESISFEDTQIVNAETIYWDAASGTPILRVVGSRG